MNETPDRDFNTPPDDNPDGWKRCATGPDLDPQNFCKRSTSNGWQTIKHIGDGQYSLYCGSSTSKASGTLAEVITIADQI